MAYHNELGKYGEQLAGVYLTENKFTILHMNWKYSWYEIDVIASRENVLHFIEIKTRSTSTFGFPEESVDKAKMGKLMKAAEQFLYQSPEWNRVQYDILSINIGKTGPPQFFLLEDVFIY